jgi:hypothetical protein
VLRTFTINTGSSASMSAPFAMTPQGSAVIMGSSAHMPTIVPAPYASAPAAVAAEPGRINTILSRLPMHSPIFWTGVGTIATAILIALGVWLGHRPESAAAHPVQMPSISPTIARSMESSAIRNGSLEDVDDKGALAGWFIADRFKDSVQLLDEGGNHFLRLKNDDPAKTVFVDQKISIEKGWKALTISARMRATDFKAGKAAPQDARVAFAFRDDKGNRVGSWPAVPEVKADSPWVDRTVTVDVPEGAKVLYMQLAMFYCTGAVDFDDIRVVPQKSQ